jgi:Flp pilus assembly protein TadG
MAFRLRRFAPDACGLAAVEFAFIFPLMLVMLFGTIEFSSGIAVDRKVTLMARTVSDLTSQSTSVANSDLINFFSAAVGIMTPYDPTPTRATLSEIYINPKGIAKIQWSTAAVISEGAARASLVTSPRNQGDVVTTIIPPALLVPNSYLIFSEVKYTYVPAIGYVMAKTGIRLGDVAYTRPRQSVCVIYPTPPSGTTTPCPI